MLNPVFSLANMRDLLPVIQPIADQLRTILNAKIPADGCESRKSRSNIACSPSYLQLLWRSTYFRGCREGRWNTYVKQRSVTHSMHLTQQKKMNTLKPSGHWRAYFFVPASIFEMNPDRPTTLRLIFLRPFIPMIVRRFSLYWRNKMMDWMPSDALKNLRHVVNVMDTASKKIFAEKRAALENEGFIGIAGNRMQGKDIMSIMRQSPSFHTRKCSTNEMATASASQRVFFQ